jgi:hypothetical protein
LFMSLHHPPSPTSLFIDHGPYPVLHNLPAK